MATSTAQEIAHALGAGLLSFPVTHLTDDYAFDEAAYRDNIGWLSQFGAAGLFAAGGTGEFFSFTPPEVEQIVRAAVDEVPDGMPVIAPAGYGTVLAVQMAQSAEMVGAQRVRHPVLQPAQPQGGLPGQHHQGRHDGDRSPCRPGPATADRSGYRRTGRTRRPRQESQLKP